MEQLFEQLRGYLNMDDEIPYEEFAEYYNNVISFLNENYENLSEEEIHKARYVMIILQSNCIDRASRKDKNMKKYKKMSEKTKLWSEATTYQLRRMGLNEKQINDVYVELNDSI